ncbi:MAG: phosphoethanolamine--lipid A transferase [Acidobacteria bacterium]|nr:phosphoethanolamine--lipid A transferase [Acidobacteriota bacterium]
MKLRPISSTALSLFAAMFMLVFHNVPFFRTLAEQYPLKDHFIFVSSVLILTGSIIALPLILASYRVVAKPVLITVLLVSAVTSFYSFQYGTVYDMQMIQNVFETNVSESLELVTFKSALWVLILGLIPSIVVAYMPLAKSSIRHQIAMCFKTTLAILIVMVAILATQGKSYASFFREHKPIREMVNPIFPIYSVVKTIEKQVFTYDQPIAEIGQGAHTPPEDDNRELIILVIGETVRSDHLSLNGYPRNTMPRLSQESVISFPNVWACATSTAASVPCMFSILGHGEFNRNQANHTENVLDVLSKSGVNVLWRDNNSDSKHAADRIAYEDFKTPERNPVCDPECRDIGMLDGLQDYIDSHKTGDILIVLHQMGNHGPGYYKRYPSDFEVFTPVCNTSELSDCSDEEITNAYDNALVYTDYFLSEVLNVLKANDGSFEAGLVYLSDHGESLGEKGIYLHGLPYAIAPESQLNVAMLMWFGQHYEIDVQGLSQAATASLSHDNLFHILLGLFEVSSDVYNSDMDITAPYRSEYDVPPSSTLNGSATHEALSAEQEQPTQYSQSQKAERGHGTPQ